MIGSAIGVLNLQVEDTGPTAVFKQLALWYRKDSNWPLGGFLTAALQQLGSGALATVV